MKPPFLPATKLQGQSRPPWRRSGPDAGAALDSQGLRREKAQREAHVRRVHRLRPPAPGARRARSQARASQTAGARPRRHQGYRRKSPRRSPIPPSRPRRISARPIAWPERISRLRRPRTSRCPRRKSPACSRGAPRSAKPPASRTTTSLRSGPISTTSTSACMPSGSSPPSSRAFPDCSTEVGITVAPDGRITGRTKTRRLRQRPHGRLRHEGGPFRQGSARPSRRLSKAGGHLHHLRNLRLERVLLFCSRSRGGRSWMEQPRAHRARLQPIPRL